ncbi:MAG: hypothetical protein QNK37_04145 [Acidobacteriota bacterium]|nr:hypothetical protein [Acidobacteriota bacterium]
MVANADLKQLERKAFRSFYQDGLWDIYLGLLLLGMGLPRILDELGLPSAPGREALIMLPLVIFALMLLVLGKKWITSPRLGYVKFSPARKKKTTVIGLILVITFLLGAGLYALVETGLVNLGGGNHLFLVFFVVLSAGVFALMAYLLDFRRLYAYGLLFALALPAAKALQGAGSAYPFLIAYVSGAIIMLAAGVAALLRFVHKYPPVSPEAAG